MSKDVSMEELEEAYAIIADIIRKRGEKFLPIFKRLHEEVLQRRVNQSLIDIALQVSSANRQM
ncbi:MAG: hypothetical protein V4561_10185 [Bacteroidota bacterium]